ncbi:MAG TPA: alkaline phosphatase family protein, partial [Chloroflexia bacterium]|nr:alkaline phosphatase family protein [Chloroflexia bacterium]
MYQLRMRSVAALGAVLLLAVGGPLAPVASAHFAEGAPTIAGAAQYFPETGKSVEGRFLDYWQGHGGLAQQGYPISDELEEQSPTDGKTYTVQYFERAVFERHPENAPPFDVLLSLLGVFTYHQKYPNGAPGQVPNTSPGAVLFPQTGHRLGGTFLAYWQQHGGLAQQGYPISDEFTEVSALNGQPYKVQYFERAVFELHPENAPPYNVLLSQLGTFRYRAVHAGGGVVPAMPAGLEKIQHFVFIMQENRSFDSYFGTYPGADGLPAGVCLADPAGGPCVAPYHDTNDVNRGGPHGWDNAQADINSGAMDGFLAQSYRGRSAPGQGGCRPPAPNCTPGRDPHDVLGWHDYHEIPNYWNDAHLYVLQDRMFESVASYSLPAHLYMLAAQSGGYVGG